MYADSAIQSPVTNHTSEDQQHGPKVNSSLSMYNTLTSCLTVGTGGLTCAEPGVFLLAKSGHDKAVVVLLSLSLLL